MEKENDVVKEFLDTKPEVVNGLLDGKESSLYSLVKFVINNSNSWNSVNDPPEESGIVQVFNPKATFDTGKQRLMYYRKVEGFPKDITHWMHKIPEPKDHE